MTQTQVMGHLVEKIGISKKEAKLTLDELNALIVRELKKERSLRFASMGIFRKRKLKARMGRNPATGESIKIPARIRLRFTPAKACNWVTKYISPAHRISLASRSPNSALKQTRTSGEELIPTNSSKATGSAKRILTSPANLLVDRLSWQCNE
jgi:DNA-binding protein HU-beta